MDYPLIPLQKPLRKCKKCMSTRLFARLLARLPTRLKAQQPKQPLFAILSFFHAFSSPSSLANFPNPYLFISHSPFILLSEDLSFKSLHLSFLFKQSSLGPLSMPHGVNQSCHTSSNCMACIAPDKHGRSLHCPIVQDWQGEGTFHLHSNMTTFPHMEEYIVYQRVWIRYFVDKYRFSEISGEIIKNQRYFPIYRRYGDKSPIFRNILDSQRKVHVATVQLQYSPLQCCYNAPSKMSFFLAVKRTQTPNKRFGVQFILPLGHVCPN